jgi:hypothetical protein
MLVGSANFSVARIIQRLRTRPVAQAGTCAGLQSCRSASDRTRSSLDPATRCDESLAPSTQLYSVDPQSFHETLVRRHVGRQLAVQLSELYGTFSRAC